MLDELRGNDQLTRGARRLAGELVEAENRLANELGRKPEADEVANALGMSHASLIAARLRTKRYDRVSLTAMDGAVPHGLMAEEPELLLDRNQREKKLQAGMDQLPERLRNILHMCCDEGLTLREIGVRLGVTEARVCQLRKEAVARLRRHCSDTVFPPAPAPVPSYEYAA
jgi:RNA polymerase sigma factor for flagellar operon FliA